MHSENNELVKAGHELAKCLDNEPLLDIAKMIVRLADKLDVTTAALREKTKQCEQVAQAVGWVEGGNFTLAEAVSGHVSGLKAAAQRSEELAAENSFLMNGAARELSIAWLLHKTMLGAQAALLCIKRGDIKSAHDWLEGTTDEAPAEFPDEIAVDGLEGWFNSQMISSGGKNGFLTREESEKAIRAETSATDAFIAEQRAQGVEMLADHLSGLGISASETSVREFAAHLRQGGAA
ncbi:hypothetical protein [Cronobacter dublinensis]|uniref:hypothetical protein n=1 Tax=Cronobacter dublinensis TaxID=413497 RepID=UPI000CFCC35C|nr:hypothetical protein [Cronobacter dublinensis]